MRFVFIIGLFVLSVTTVAQQLNLPMQTDLTRLQERDINRSDSTIHTGVMPYVQSFSGYDPQVRPGYEAFPDKVPDYANMHWIFRRIKHEHLFTLKPENTGNFYLEVDPVFNFGYGIDNADTTARAEEVNYITNTRGFLLQGNIGEKFSFGSAFYENQAYFPTYIDDRIRDRGEYFGVFPNNNQQNGVVPGQGRTKPFKTYGYDYGFVTGYVSYTPSKNFNFQFGQGKNFIGEGHRSLLLSDNTFHYPNLRITTRLWKNRIQLTHIYSWLSSLYRIAASSTPESLYMPKAGTFHYVSFVPHKAVQFGFFEGVIWNRYRRVSGGTRPFNTQFINPIIGTNALILGMEDEHNAVLGLTGKAKIKNDYVVYGQYMVDGPDKNGYQLGVKMADVLGVKNLFTRVEYNTVSRYTYATNEPLHNYSHFNQELAHPLGAGFRELMVQLHYRYRDLWISAAYMSADPFLDVDGSNNGSDIFLRQDEGPRDVRRRADIDLYDIKIGYLINPATNMNVVVGLINRNQTHPLLPTQETQFIYVGLRTWLNNAYFDF